MILVLDISQVSRTAAAIVHGLHTFDPAVRLSGVILNKAGSARHADEIVAAMEATGLPVLGVLPRDAGIEAPSRHLGLVPAAERSAAADAVARLAEQVAEHINLTEVLAIAYAAPPLSATPWSPTDVVASAVGGPAGGRDRGRSRVHLPLRRDRRTAPGRRLRTRRLRPAHRSGAAGGDGRAVSRRRLSRGACRRAVGERRAARGRAPSDRGRPAHRGRVRRPALPVPEPWTVRRWSARSTPRRR